jgi:hypothetical protein
VRAAAAVGVSAAAVNSEQGNSSSGSECAVAWILFSCICVVARAVHLPSCFSFTTCEKHASYSLDEPRIEVFGLRGVTATASE